MSLRAVLEKKLSIVDRAVESNPTNVDLKLEKLRLCKELWEPATLQKEWKKLVFIHPNSAPLWRKYLLFTQSHFSMFSVSKVNSVFGKCLSTLSAVQDGSMVSHPPLPGTQEDLLGIAILYTGKMSILCVEQLLDSPDSFSTMFLLMSLSVLRSFMHCHSFEFHLFRCEFAAVGIFFSLPPLMWL